MGSVKANIGHLEGASGLASLIKAILIVERGIIPPSALFEKLNPAIEADRFNIVIPTASVTWPDKGLRRVSVNSFGFGGSNSHLILDDALHYLKIRGLAANHHGKIENTATLPIHENGEKGIKQSDVPAQRNPTSTRGQDSHCYGSPNVHQLACRNGSAHGHKKPKLLVWTAADEKATKRLTKAYIPFYQNKIESSTPERVNQLAYTLSNRRGRMLWRSFAVAQEGKLISPGKPVRSSTERGLVFIFTGQGAQYAGMGMGLLQYPVFACQLERIDAIYKSLGSGWSVLDELRHPDHIDEPEFSQPLCTAVQIGLVEVLRSFGVVAETVIGHSSGEIAAAYTTGALCLESACKVAHFRGKLAERVRVKSPSSPGAMIAINLPEDQVSEYLEKTNKTGLSAAVCIACVNSPLNCTLSGQEWAIDAVKAQADTDGIFAQKLATGVPYHSLYLRCISEEYVLLMGNLKRGQEGRTPVSMVSSVSGQPISPSTLLSAQYWADNMLSPVQFLKAVQYVGSQRQETVNTLTDILEIGPHPALRRPIQDTLSYLESKIRYHYTLHRSESSTTRILDLAGELFCLGYPVCISTTNQQHTPLPFLVDCPPYPFDRSQFWSESRLSRDYRLRGKASKDTLGTRVADWNPLEPRWRNFFSVESHSWIGDHKISDTILYPAAGMLIMILEAAHQMVPEEKTAKGYLFKRVDFLSPIIVPDPWSDRVETQVQLRPVRQPVELGLIIDEFDVSIFSYIHGVWKECCRANIHVDYEGMPARHLEDIRNQHERAINLCKTHLDSRAIYNDAGAHGLWYGDWFRLIQTVRSDGERTAVSRVDVHSKHRTDRFVHPAVLDQIFQVLRVAAGQLPAANIPVNMVNAWFAASGWQETHEVHIAAKVTQVRTRSGEKGRISVVGKGGVILCSVESAVTATVASINASKMVEKQLLYSIEWRPQLSLLLPAQLQALFSERILKDERGIVANHAMLCDILNIVTARTLSLINEEKVPPALKEHVGWMERHVRKHVTAIQLEHAASIGATELEDQLCKIDSILPAWTLYTTCARKLPEILAGEIDPLQVVFESDQARVFYADLFQTLCADGRLAGYLDLAAHENPALRILEVGAGTGGMTGHILAALQEREARTGAVAFASYTYTDISPAFFEQARLRWPQLQAEGRLEFSVFDMDRPLASQGFLPGSYDIVIAGSVLHVTPDLDATIRNVCTALTLGGHLILLEAVKPDNVATNFMAGLVPGWWGAREEWRGHSAAVSEPLWDQRLRANGFSGVDLVLRDYNEDECHNMSIIITTAFAPAGGEVTQRGLKKPPLVIVIMESPEQQKLANVLCEHLGRSRWRSTVVVFGPSMAQERWSSDTIVVCIAEVNNRPLVASLTEEDFTCLKHVTSHSQLLWVTASSFEDPQYPDYGAVHGLLRCIRAERVDSHIVTLSIEDGNTATSCALLIETVLEVAFLSQSREVEYVVRDGHFVTGRAVKDIQGQTTLRNSLARTPLSPRPEKVLLDHGVSAYYALVELARLRPGDLVLIDRVSGRTGRIAALIAQKCGAQVFATALPEDKQFLVGTLGIAEDRILSTHERSSKSDLLQHAGGEGFHVVLSSLPYNAAHFGLLLKHVASGGHLLIIEELEKAARRETFCIPNCPINVSLSLIQEDLLDPSIHTRITKKLGDFFADDIGKVGSFISDKPEGLAKESLATTTESTSAVWPKSDMPIMRFSANILQLISWKFPQEGSYLIVGGSGGLGRAIIRWMADHGAKHIILLSRSGASSERTQTMLADLLRRGVNIRAFTCDASSESSLASVLQTCNDTMPSIRGCINAAMVLQDAVFHETMTFAQWTATMRSKVQTSRNLHRLLPSSLDFFILLSSLLGVTGQIASANYAAGCTFQDALARYRRANGQTALSLDLGWMRDVGIIAETPAYQRQRHATDDMQPIETKELLAVLEMCLHLDQGAEWKTPEKAGQVLLGLRTPADILRDGRQPPTAFYQPLVSPFACIPGGPDCAPKNSKAGVTEMDINTTQLFKQAVDPKERARVVFRALAAKLARAISISPDDIEPQKPLSSFGVDSLMAVELRNWIVREFEAPLAVFDIMGGVSVTGVVDVIVQKSRMKLV
ncbi:hypothetical protein BJX70DRAFT_215652 [Aspergillus crustosus]